MIKTNPDTVITSATWWMKKDGMPKDWVILLGSLATLGTMYVIGYLCIDVAHLFALTPWQAEESHISGVRVFTGGLVLAVPAIILLWREGR